MSTLLKIQNWYKSQCDGTWEHTNGISIETLDNPGWHVSIDIEKTRLNGKTFNHYEYGTNNGNNDWVSCKIENGKFIAAAGPGKLEEILEIFIKWAEI